MQVVEASDALVAELVQIGAVAETMMVSMLQRSEWVPWEFPMASIA